MRSGAVGSGAGSATGAGSTTGAGAGAGAGATAKTYDHIIATFFNNLSTMP